MTKDEALKLALEALEANQPVNYCMNNNGEKFPMMQEDPFRFERNTKAITAIKKALAQPEEKYQYGTPLLDAMTKDYVPPQRTWVGLTDEEISELIRATHNTGSFVRAIEAKLKEKNT